MRASLYWSNMAAGGRWGKEECVSALQYIEDNSASDREGCSRRGPPPWAGWREARGSPAPPPAPPPAPAPTPAHTCLLHEQLGPRLGAGCGAHAAGAAGVGQGVGRAPLPPAPVLLAGDLVLGGHPVKALGDEDQLLVVALGGGPAAGGAPRELRGPRPRQPAGKAGDRGERRGRHRGREGPKVEEPLRLQVFVLPVVGQEGGRGRESHFPVMRPKLPSTSSSGSSSSGGSSISRVVAPGAAPTPLPDSHPGTPGSSPAPGRGGTRWGRGTRSRAPAAPAAPPSRRACGGSRARGRRCRPPSGPGPPGPRWPRRPARRWRPRGPRIAQVWRRWPPR